MEFAEVVRCRHMARRFTGEPCAGGDCGERRWPVPFWPIDTGMAALLILLTVVDEGLGAL